MIKPFARRHFLKSSLLGAAAISLAGSQRSEGQTAVGNASRTAPSDTLGIIDTNVNLFDWPFRALKYRDTKALVAKLKKHRVIEAWAGSFEALLSKDMSGVNTRLANECRTQAPGFLIPFGSVNLAWPDWEEDVRRCHEVFKMPGLRIYPGYQPFDLDHPGMAGLVRGGAPALRAAPDHRAFSAAPGFGARARRKTATGTVNPACGRVVRSCVTQDRVSWAVRRAFDLGAEDRVRMGGVGDKG